MSRLVLIFLTVSFYSVAQPGGPPFDPPACQNPNPPPFCGNSPQVPIDTFSDYFMVGVGAVLLLLIIFNSRKYSFKYK